MAVVADLGVDVEVVEQDELAGERVGVGRDLLAEEAEARIAVAFRHVAEDLIVGAVFLDDVEDVPDRRCAADRARDRRGRGSSRRPQAHGVAVRRDRVDLLRVGGEGPGTGNGHDRQRSLEDIARRLPHRRGDGRLRAPRVGGRRQSLPGEDEDPLSIRRELRRRRIPAGRKETLDAAPGGIVHGDDRDVVVVGVGDEESAPVGRKRETVGRRARGGPRVERDRDLLAAWQEATSATQTALVLAQATKRRVPSLESAIALGCSPTAISPAAESVSVSKTRTFAPPQSET